MTRERLGRVRERANATMCVCIRRSPCLPLSPVGRPLLRARACRVGSHLGRCDLYAFPVEEENGTPRKRELIMWYEFARTSTHTHTHFLLELYIGTCVRRYIRSAVMYLTLEYNYAYVAVSALCSIKPSKCACEYVCTCVRSCVRACLRACVPACACGCTRGSPFHMVVVSLFLPHSCVVSLFYCRCSCFYIGICRMMTVSKAPAL